MSSDDELTPPPPETTEAPAHQISSTGKRKRGPAVTYAESSGGEASEAIEEPKRGKKTPTKKAKAENEGHILSSEPIDSEKKPKRARKTPTKTAGVISNGDDFVDEAVEEIEEKPKRARKTPTKKALASDDSFGDESPLEEEVEKPKKARKTPTKKKAESASGDEDKPKKAKKATPKKSRIAKDEPEYDSEGNEIVKKKRKPKEYKKIEYDIPPVERKETTFRGECVCVVMFLTARSTGICVSQYGAAGDKT